MLLLGLPVFLLYTVKLIARPGLRRMAAFRGNFRYLDAHSVACNCEGSGCCLSHGTRPGGIVLLTKSSMLHTRPDGRLGRRRGRHGGPVRRLLLAAVLAVWGMAS